MNRDLSLALWQVRYEQRAFWRNPRAAIFSFGFPLMLIAFFGALGADPEQFVPGLLAYGVAMSTYSNLAISFAILRDSGIIKRVQGTPLPWWTYLAGRLGSTVLNAALMSAIALVVARLAFGLDLPLAGIPAVAATLGLAVVALTGLGVGLVRWIPNADSAPAITMFTVLPLSFISGVFAPTEGEPGWLLGIARAFPLEPLGHALRTAFASGDVVGRDLAVLAVWCVVGAALSGRFVRSLTERA